MARTYKTISQDTWDLISYRCYGDEHYIAELIAANFEYRNMVIFPADVVLVVPEIEAEDSTSDLPPWKRGDSS